MRHVDDLGPDDFSRLWSEVHMTLLSTLSKREYSFIVAQQCKSQIDECFLTAVDLRWVLQDSDRWSETWAAEVATAARAYRDAMMAVAARARALLADAERAQRLPENVSELRPQPFPARPRIAKAREAMHRTVKG